MTNLLAVEPAYLGFSFWTTLIIIVVLFAVLQGTCAYLILLERKIAAWTQDRVGPNRVGPWGVLQPIADGLKFLFKEEIIPNSVDKVFYLLAPGIAVSTALLAIAVVPFGPTTTPPERPWMQTVSEEKVFEKTSKGTAFWDDLARYDLARRDNFVIAPHVDIGIVYVLAIGSLAIYAIVLGGWSSNSKYSFLGSLRSSAQLISYEIPMGMSVLGVILVTGSLNLEKMIAFQAANGWNFLFQPLACLLFVTAIFAECNRLPFDLPECEQELVGGYHTEYSSMRFAMFFLGEYTHMITTSFLVVTMFFGGWLLPGVTDPSSSAPVLKLIIFAGKMALFIVFFMVIRWTLPRFRFDQLMGLAWKVLIPLALGNLVMVTCIKHFGQNNPYAHWWMLPLSILILVISTAITLALPAGPTKTALSVRGHGTDRPVISPPQTTGY